MACVGLSSEFCLIFVIEEDGAPVGDVKVHPCDVLSLALGADVDDEDPCVVPIKLQ